MSVYARLCTVLAVVIAGGCSEVDVCRGRAGTCIALRLDGEVVSTVEQVEVSLSVGDRQMSSPRTPTVADGLHRLPLELAVPVEATLAGAGQLSVVAYRDGSPIADGT